MQVHACTFACALVRRVTQTRHFPCV